MEALNELCGKHLVNHETVAQRGSPVLPSRAANDWRPLVFDPVEKRRYQPKSTTAAAAQCPAPSAENSNATETLAYGCSGALRCAGYTIDEAHCPTGTTVEHMEHTCTRFVTRNKLHIFMLAAVSKIQLTKSMHASHNHKHMRWHCRAAEGKLDSLALHSSKRERARNTSKQARVIEAVQFSCGDSEDMRANQVCEQ